MELKNYEEILRKRQSVNKRGRNKNDPVYWKRIEKLEEMVRYFAPTTEKATHQMYAQLQRLCKAHADDKTGRHFTFVEQAYNACREKGIKNINYLYVTVNNKKKSI